MSVEEASPPPKKGRDHSKGHFDALRKKKRLLEVRLGEERVAHLATKAQLAKALEVVEKLSALLEKAGERQAS